MTRLSKVLGLTLLTTFLLCAFSASAWAKDTVVLIVSGPDNSRVFRYAQDALEDEHLKIPDDDDVLSFIDKNGLDITVAEDRVLLAGEYGARAVLIVDVTDDRRDRDIDITIYNGADGEKQGIGSVNTRTKKRRMKKDIKRYFYGQVDGDIGKSSPPTKEDVAEVAEADEEEEEEEQDVEQEEDEQDVAQEEEEEDEEEDQEEEEDEEEEEASPTDLGERQPLDIQVGFRTLTRILRYNDDIFSQLLRYDLAMGPSVGADLVWYPGGHFTDGVGAHIGLAAHFHYSFAIDSNLQGGDSDAFPTTNYGWLVSARGRIPIGLTEIGLDAGMGQEVFTIDNIDDSTPKPEIPSVEYLFFRPAIWSRIGIVDNFSILADVGYRLVLDAGEIQSDDYFPNSDVQGLDTTVGVSWAIIPALELRGTVEWQHYFYNLNPEPGDRWIAGGARDEFISGTVALAYRMYQ